MKNIEVVHARSRVPGWIAFFACRRTKAIFVTTCHGFYKTKWFSQVMGWGKVVIAPSEVIARHMIDHYKVSKDSVEIIHRSVDLTKFKLSKIDKKKDEHKVVTMVGRITPLKGHKYFIKAMARVIRNRPLTKVLIVGEAPAKKEDYFRELQVLVGRLGISENVEFLGNRGDIPQILSETDVLVLSTVTQEAFGRVILEAQAAGVPVVATKVGGVIDIIDDHETGLLVFPKDTDQMADAVRSLLDDEKKSKHLVSQAKKKIKKQFMLEHMASKTLACYEKVLKSKNILVVKLSFDWRCYSCYPFFKGHKKKICFG